MVKSLAIVLGIRPDIIRASIILEILRRSQFRIVLIWTGQHYSENLKEAFFRELKARRPDVELNIRGKDDTIFVSSLIRRLGLALEKVRPDGAVFLGDTNTVMGCLAAAQRGIPIIHIEGCMRSYDWRMPEEKYRIVADHLSDVIYAYLDEYKQQGIREGLNPSRIIVTGNPIVDVLDKFYYAHLEHYQLKADDSFFKRRGLRKDEYYLMTCHRRENVEDELSLRNIFNLIRATDRCVYFPASYRTQRMLRRFKIRLPANIIEVDPVGYEEFLRLMCNACGVFTDSGTVAEEACVLHIPAVQMRMSTERPQLYDVGASVKFDPTCPEGYLPESVMAKLECLRGKTWSNPLGDGHASERIAADLLTRLESNTLASHKPSQYHIGIQHAFRNDGLQQILHNKT